MTQHKVYRALIDAVKRGQLEEPFGVKEFRTSCPNLGKGTYRAFLWKHSVGNGKETELFDKVAPGRFKLIRPFRNGF